MARSTKLKPKSHHDYLSQLDPERRAALTKLSQQILRVLPDAEACVSYSMPAFRLAGGGKVVAGFLAASWGCSYYPFSGSTLRTLAPELTGYEQTSGALHFDARRGLPLALVRKLLQTRIAEISAVKPVGKAPRSAPPQRPKKRG